MSISSNSSSVLQSDDSSHTDYNESQGVIEQTRGCPIDWTYHKKWEAIAESSERIHEGSLDDCPESAMFWRDSNNCLFRVFDSKRSKFLFYKHLKKPCLLVSGGVSFGLSLDTGETRDGRPYCNVILRETIPAIIQGVSVLSMDLGDYQSRQVVARYRLECEYYCPDDQDPSKDRAGDLQPPVVYRMPKGWTWEKSNKVRKAFGVHYDTFFNYEMFGLDGPRFMTVEEYTQAAKDIAAKEKAKAEEDTEDKEATLDATIAANQAANAG